MSLLNLRVPFFIPLWRRYALVGYCVAWAIYELATGGLAVGAVFGGIGAYAAWQFFFSGWPADVDDASDAAESD